MPVKPSTINSSGMMEIISRSGGTDLTLAAIMTLLTSFSVISRVSLETAIIP